MPSSDPSPSPEVAEAMLDRAVAAYYKLAESEEQLSPREEMQAVLTAALRLDDPEGREATIKRVKEALGRASGDPRTNGWRGFAEAVVDALGPLPPPASDPETVERVAQLEGVIRDLRAIIDTPLNEREGDGPWRSDLFMRLEARVRRPDAQVPALDDGEYEMQEGDYGYP